MQSIERYGVIALIFLVVTVVAVLMWDSKQSTGGKDASGIDGRATALVDPKASKTTLRGTGRPLLRESESGLLQGTEPSTIPMRVDAPSGLGVQANTLAEGEGEVLSGAEEPLRGSTATPPGEPPPERLEGTLPPSSKRLYTVRKGDTLSEIAARELGSSKRWLDIVEVNPGLDPAKLGLGTRLVMPAGKSSNEGPARGASTSLAKAPAPNADRRYVVRDGDSLWKIAARELGDGERWQEIVALNPKLNPNLLKAGQSLALPGGGKPRAQADRGEAVLVAVSTPAEKASQKGPETRSTKGKVR